MLKEIRKLKTRKTKYYIYMLQSRKHIGSYYNEKGYKCYDPDELKRFKQTRKWGRPLNKEENKNAE